VSGEKQGGNQIGFIQSFGLDWIGLDWIEAGRSSFLSILCVHKIHVTWGLFLAGKDKLAKRAIYLEGINAILHNQIK
jgi:hypothetical protein